jgi:hypothetical protein
MPWNAPSIGHRWRTVWSGSSGRKSRRLRRKQPSKPPRRWPPFVCNIAFCPLLWALIRRSHLALSNCTTRRHREALLPADHPEAVHPEVDHREEDQQLVGHLAQRLVGLRPAPDSLVDRKADLQQAHLLVSHTADRRSKASPTSAARFVDCGVTWRKDGWRQPFRLPADSGFRSRPTSAWRRIARWPNGGRVACTCGRPRQRRYP